MGCCYIKPLTGILHVSVVLCRSVSHIVSQTIALNTDYMYMLTVQELFFWIEKCICQMGHVPHDTEEYIDVVWRVPMCFSDVSALALRQ